MTDARATQVAAEVWALPNASVQVTQVGAEMWATAGAGSRLALATIVALEEWGVLPTTGAPVVNRNTAVTVNTG
jgi:hypothetical protein